MTALEIVLKFAILFGLLAIIAGGIYRRYLIERKLKELLDGIPVKRGPPFFEVDLRSVPESQNGREYMAYYRKTSRRGVVFLLIAFGWLAVATVALELLEG